MVMRKMNKMKAYAKTLWYLLIKDKGSYPTTRYIPATTLSFLIVLWSYPLENFSATGEMCPQVQYKWRMVLTIISLSICLMALFIHGYKRFQKYTNTHKLTDDELNNYLKYMSNGS